MREIRTINMTAAHIKGYVTSQMLQPKRWVHEIDILYLQSKEPAKVSGLNMLNMSLMKLTWQMRL